MFARDLLGEIRDHLWIEKEKSTNIIHVLPRYLRRPELTTNINTCKYGFISKMQTLIAANSNEFTVFFKIKD